MAIVLNVLLIPLVIALCVRMVTIMIRLRSETLASQTVLLIPYSAIGVALEMLQHPRLMDLKFLANTLPMLLLPNAWSVFQVLTWIELPLMIPTEPAQRAVTGVLSARKMREPWHSHATGSLKAIGITTMVIS